MAVSPDSCRFAGCARPRIGRKKLCVSHLRQSERGIELRPIRPHKSKSLADRLAARTHKTDRCWHWTGAVTGNGYGSMWGDAGQMTTAHRVAFELANGPLSDDLHVDHTCRNRLCVNPKHLRVATNKQNHENLGIAARNNSGVRGVYWAAARGKWAARVTHNYRAHHVGYFDSITDAEAAVINKRNELFTHNIERSEAA